MALPTSREITAGPAADIPSNAFNAVQDAIIGKKFASRPRTIIPVPHPGSAYSLGGVGYIESAGIGGARVNIPTEEGEEVTDITFKAWGTNVGAGGVDVNYDLCVLGNDNVTVTVLGTLADNDRAAAWGDVTFAVTDHIMAAGETLYLSAGASAAGARLGRIKTTFRRL